MVRLKKGDKTIHCDDSQVIAFANQGWKVVPDAPEKTEAVVPGESPGSIQYRKERLAEKGAVPMTNGDRTIVVEKAQVEAFRATGWEVAGDEPTEPQAPDGDGDGPEPQAPDGDEPEEADADEG